MEIDLEEQGFDVVLDNLNRLAPALAARVVGAGLFEGAKAARDFAKRYVPVRTGQLRDSIYAARRSGLVENAGGRRRVPGARAVFGAGRRGANHSVFIEYGTRNHPPQPFIAPAIERHRTEIFEKMAQGARAGYGKLQTELASGNISKTTRRLSA